MSGRTAEESIAKDNVTSPSAGDARVGSETLPMRAVPSYGLGAIAGEPSICSGKGSIMMSKSSLTPIYVSLSSVSTVTVCLPAGRM